jgi:predicted nucleic acid-binding protein
MNTLNFLDANVWLALLWGRHIHSEKGARVVREVARREVFFLPIHAVDGTPAAHIGGNNGE